MAASSTTMDAVQYGVSYQGIVSDAGISIYMQGSHRLEIMGGTFVLLESDDVDLDAYVGKEVEVYGDARDSVEGDATVLTVTDITVLNDTTSSSVSSVAASSEASSVIAASSVPASSRAASVVRSVVANSSVASSISPVAAASTMPASSMDAQMARAEAMAKTNLAPANWTRQYCPPQQDFCFPIHKNWYYNSFGTTTSYVWHVELNNEAIEKLGDGLISVNLVTGTATSKGGADGQIETRGEFIIGYRDWHDGNHFEIVAPAVLNDAVRYIMEHITEAPASSASSAVTTTTSAVSSGR